MPLESGSYISDLVPTNPAGTDQRRQGDDHLRLVKSILQTSFPNINGAVTATPAELNKTADATNFFPSGGIIAWAGLIAAIPAGWALCNGTGTTTNGIAIPDLRNRFILGADSDAGGTDDVNDTGGSRNISFSGFSSGATALSVAQMPAHTHTIGASNTDVGAGVVEAGSAPSTFSYATGSAGSGASHSHSLSVPSGTGLNLPPYYALAYIIKT